MSRFFSIEGVGMRNRSKKSVRTISITTTAKIKASNHSRSLLFCFFVDGALPLTGTAASRCWARGRARPFFRFFFLRLVASMLAKVCDSVKLGYLLSP